ncbi:MAG TPA: MerR family transcriptional regulator [Actinophytocola sp.]|uniref:MerR family transcriptional regulator n=1 Tax=Actinophytocola sp. TaxID=1872138 RepID=UPI002DBCD8B6|nr:MerR family transcriptional regulator [Actinophytocola sp.]HEU5473308.1 MerR family transcriptional regulator [Actinophytocola sp.]
MRDELFSAGEVARRLGVAVTTLRTWHQRYGLGPSHHQSGQHRRYTTDDLARLETMRELTARGVPASAAARLAQDARDAVPASRDGGGHAIPVGRAGAPARGLARAAMRLDQAGMRAVLTAAIDAHGVVSTWDTVVCPVLRGIGARHARTRALVEVEHLLSRCVSEVLARAASQPLGSLPTAVLLACADEEQHSLPLEALAAALAQRGNPSRLLGARVPSDSLQAAVRRTGPRVVILWSHDRTTADPDQLEVLLRLRPTPAVIAAAGPGWRSVPLPPDVRTPATLTDAIHLAGGF